MPSFDEIMEMCKAATADVVTWRRHIHQHPELAFKETQTCKYITDVLEGLACPQLKIQHLTPTSTVADLIGGAGEGPIIALRADIDALPLKEESGEPFASVNENVMHACGHDAHTAMLLGAAKVLCANWQSLKGTVRFMFQHAEELLPGGAIDLVRAGIMDGVQKVFGMHVSPFHSTGTLIVKNGVVLSNADFVTITVCGRGGHASMPHLSIDPVPIAAEIVTALQTIITRKVDAKHMSVLSITTITTGPNESHNVTPDNVKLMGTIRTQDLAVRETVRTEIERIAKGITEAHGATYKMDYVVGYDMVDNDASICDELRSLARRMFGNECIVEMEHALLGGEDFSQYQHKAPGCFVLLCSGNAEKNTCASLHSCKFRLDEDALPIGVKMHVAFVCNNLIA